MRKHLSALILLAGALVATTALPQGSTPTDSLVVHEWGTFTSVAGPDGKAVEWTPFSGPSDLPCFVTLLNPTSLKTGPKGYLPTVKATVRMETPVLYFYASREQTINAKVRFPHGLITEWYPHGSVPPVPAMTALANMTGGIEWKDVKVSPGAKTPFPVEAGKSHYYAARETDASPVQVGAQHEKFLFYRGVASFPVALSATVKSNRTIDVQNTGGDDIRTMVLFESDGKRVGYRVLRGAPRHVTLAPPALTSNLDSLRQDLEALLVGHGLYRREAKAMVETWRDSWFEQGTRLFYLLPQSSVDSILPLKVDPQPAEVVRVFVGRLEIITSAMQTEVEQALRRNDLTTLTRYGRFLEPITAAISGQPKVQAVLRDVARYPAPAATCRATTTP
jgi:hypothetical protein